jgi:hypothetical protein
MENPNMQRPSSFSSGKDTDTDSEINLSSVMPEIESAFASITQAVVGILEARLRAEIESRIQEVTNEAARTIHARIAMAMGQIQPVAIPINLLVQPSTLLQNPAPVSPPPVVDAGPASTPHLPVSVSAEPPAPTAPKVLPVITEQETEDPPVPLEVVSTPTAQARPNDAETVSEPAWEDPPLRESRPASGGADVVAVVPSSPKKSRLKITVVGLKPGQAHMIKNDFKLIQLNFVASNSGNSSQLTALSKSNDRVIFMTDFISHKSVDVVRAANGRFIYLAGGMTALREKLHGLNREHLASAEICDDSTPPPSSR